MGVSNLHFKNDSKEALSKARKIFENKTNLGSLRKKLITTSLGEELLVPTGKCVPVIEQLD